MGETIASSAGTVIVGLSTMALAELGLFNTTGPAVAIGVAIALAAGLTLTPALLALLGDHTFWPRRARHISEGRFWHRWAGVVTGRPVVALLVTLVVLVPLAVYGQGQQRDFDLLGDLPADVPAHEGYHVLADHLGPGVMQPINVVLENENTPFDTPAGLQRLETVTKELAKVGHVARVTSFTSSLGSGGTLSVAKQLADYAKGVEDGERQLAAERQRAAAASRRSPGTTPPPATQAAVQQAAKGLLDIFSYLQQLGSQYPEVTSTEAYRSAMTALQTIAQAAGVSPTGSTTAQAGASLGVEDLSIIQPMLARLASSLRTLQGDFAKRPEALMLPKTYVANNEGLRSLQSSYLSNNGQATRFQVILDSGPYTPEALATIEQIRSLVAREGGGAVEGTTAIVADLRDASNRDMTRVILFVLTGVFVVLVLLLRAVVAPIYLILTILLSYGATLGIVRIVFGNLLHAGGVTWWVPIFMFVMLVALGMDYNIFLMGRVKEEVALSGNREGVRTAVARTGGIITSAGIIMAGTFAAMMSGQILGLRADRLGRRRGRPLGHVRRPDDPGAGRRRPAGAVELVAPAKREPRG